MRRILVSLLVAIIASCASSLAQEISTQEPTGRPRQALDQPSPGDTRYVVQLESSFATAEKANEVTTQLRRKFPTAYTQKPSGSETRYRVRIGPFDSRDDAMQVASELAAQGFVGATILRSRGPSPTPTADPQDKSMSTSPVQDPDDLMRRAVTNLSTQIGLLTDEMRKLRRETERNSGMMELLLNEDRLSKVEDKIQDANNAKAQLDAREQDIQRRMRNIQGELLLRGGLRREEAEAVIRSELQRGLEDVRGQQVIYQQRIAELNEQATRLRARVESLRKKLETLDLKSEKEEK